jgi:DNA-binding NtrC family response regulator
MDTAVRCMGKGAYDYVVKGSDPERLVSSVRRALESARKAQGIEALRERMQSVNLRHPAAFEALVTTSELMRSLFRFIEAVAGTDEPLLVQGETGTGKELLAHAIHLSSQSSGPFVATNLGGLDDFMVSDTLFGHTKGAYTGADEVRKGLVSTAAGGTLFLDEIGDMSPASQVKLLRFLEHREYFPLGSDVPRRSDARIVAATNRDLEQLAEEGKFRRDLYFRLATYRVLLPPLRERPEDIGVLAEHLLSKLSQGREQWVLTSGALHRLSRHSFPGNVRELRGLLMRAKVSTVGPVIDRHHIEQLLGASSPNDQHSDTLAPPLAFPSRLPTIRQAVEELITEALRRTGGQQNLAAGLLGITPQALSKRLKKPETSG